MCFVFLLSLIMIDAKETSSVSFISPCHVILFTKSGTEAVKSKYACQKEKLRLRCNNGYVLRIYAARYGRLEPGSSICPHQNITTVSCDAPDTLMKMLSRCSNKRKCTVIADKEMFGDPCPGTFKYLDVIYGCGKLLFHSLL